MPGVAVNGFTAPGFEPVGDVFRENFRRRGDVGAACAVYLDGRPVVDLWGGYADRRRRRPWLRDTKVLVFSSTKGMSSLAFATLHARGLVDYDERVAAYWPEFAEAGKEAITIRQLLAHEAGLMVIDRLLTVNNLRDKDSLAAILAKQRPHPAALGKKAYHTWTISLYQSELARRADPLGRSIGALFHDEIARPLDADFHIGIPAGISPDEVAELIPFNPVGTLLHARNEIPWRLLLGGFGPSLIPVRSFLNPVVGLSPLVFNQRHVQATEVGSATGIGTARALARVYGEFAQRCPSLPVGPPTLDALESFPENINNGLADLVLKENLIYSLGLEKPSTFFRFGADNRAYGHQGAGGSAAFADPANRLGFAYVMNRMGTCVANDPRERALRDAVYACLGKWRGDREEL